MLTPAPRACGEAGRALFFEHVGTYFSAAPRLEPVPIGTACPRCGATDVQLWMTASDQLSCIAQQTIVRKRRGRKQADEPCRPANDMAGMVAMAEGTFAVAGPNVARISTRLLPDRELPPHVEVIFPEPGVIAQILRALVEAPPAPPFVAILFGKNASFAAAPTHDASRLIICGPDGFVIDTPHVRRLLALLGGIKPKRVAEILTLRDRLAAGDARNGDDKSFAALKSEHPEILAAFRHLPSPGTPAARMLRRLMEP